MPIWGNNPGTALPRLSYCFCSFPDISKSALWYHFNSFLLFLFFLASENTNAQVYSKYDRGSNHHLIPPSPRPLLSSLQSTQGPKRTVLIRSGHLWEACRPRSWMLWRCRCKLEHNVYVCVWGGGRWIAHLLETEIKLKMPGSLIQPTTLVTLQRCHRPLRHLISLSTSSCEQLIVANFAFICNPEFQTKAYFITISLEY